MGAQRAYDLEDVVAFNRVFIPVLRSHPAIASVIHADGRGRELMLLRMPGGEWHNKVSDVERWGKRQQWIKWRAPDDAYAREWQAQDYDPRTRPWHAGALGLTDERRVFWTAPYVFFSSKEPGIAAAVRWSGSKGEVRVLAFDVNLTAVSAYTAALGVGRAGASRC